MRTLATSRMVNVLKLVIALAVAGVLRCNYVYGQIETCKYMLCIYQRFPFYVVLVYYRPKNLAGHLGRGKKRRNVPVI